MPRNFKTQLAGQIGERLVVAELGRRASNRGAREMPEYEVQFQSGKTIRISDERTLEKMGNAFVESGRLATEDSNGVQLCLFVSSVEAIFEIGNELQTETRPRQRELKMQKAYSGRHANP